MKNKQQRILFGGSFDPVHMGHQALLETVLTHYPKAIVHVVVSEFPVLREAYVASYSHRLAMVRLLWGQIPRVIIEEARGLLYTVDIITTLTRVYPESIWFLVIGSDQLQQFHCWERYQELLIKVQLIEVTRAKTKTEATQVTYGQEVIPFQHTASSSAVRRGDFRYLSAEIREYIYQHRLYYHHILQQLLSPARYTHSVSTAHYVAQLAKYYQVDEQLSYYAALFHDVAKEIPHERMLVIMEKYFPHLLHYHPNVYHSFVGSWWVQEYQLFTDPLIIRAIYEHTLGLASDIYSKMVFVGDKLEPLRTHFDNYLYQLSWTDLDRTIILIKERRQHHQKI